MQKSKSSLSEFQLQLHPATKTSTHTLFSSMPFKVTVLQLVKLSWLLFPAVGTVGTVYKFKSK